MNRVERGRWKFGPALFAAIGIAAGLAIGVVFWRAPAAASSVMRARVDASPADGVDAGGMHPRRVLTPGDPHTGPRPSPAHKAAGMIVGD